MTTGKTIALTKWAFVGKVMSLLFNMLSRYSRISQILSEFKMNLIHSIQWGFTGGPDSKEFACNAGDLGLIPRSGRSPGEGSS